MKNVPNKKKKKTREARMHNLLSMNAPQETIPLYGSHDFYVSFTPDRSLWLPYTLSFFLRKKKLVRLLYLCAVAPFASNTPGRAFPSLFFFVFTCNCNSAACRALSYTRSGHRPRSISLLPNLLC